MRNDLKPCITMKMAPCMLLVIALRIAVLPSTDSLDYTTARSILWKQYGVGDVQVKTYFDAADDLAKHGAFESAKELLTALLSPRRADGDSVETSDGVTVPADTLSSIADPGDTSSAAGVKTVQPVLHKARSASKGAATHRSWYAYSGTSYTRMQTGAFDTAAPSNSDAYSSFSTATFQWQPRLSMWNVAEIERFEESFTLSTMAAGLTGRLSIRTLKSALTFDASACIEKSLRTAVDSADSFILSINPQFRHPLGKTTFSYGVSAAASTKRYVHPKPGAVPHQSYVLCPFLRYDSEDLTKYITVDCSIGRDAYDLQIFGRDTAGSRDTVDDDRRWIKSTVSGSIWNSLFSLDIAAHTQSEQYPFWKEKATNSRPAARDELEGGIQCTAEPVERLNLSLSASAMRNRDRYDRAPYLITSLTTTVFDTTIIVNVIAPDIIDTIMWIDTTTDVVDTLINDTVPNCSFIVYSYFFEPQVTFQNSRGLGFSLGLGLEWVRKKIVVGERYRDHIDDIAGLSLYQDYNAAAPGIGLFYKKNNYQLTAGFAIKITKGIHVNAGAGDMAARGDCHYDDNTYIEYRPSIECLFYPLPFMLCSVRSEYTHQVMKDPFSGEPINRPNTAFSISTCVSLRF